ncbi:hypothetical protein RRG08_012310 [Elysia crispata]|uniref:Uncharacterized protein n=1 Tax=Elysia crispata TaxID=231223 RepID=A0AAE1BC48_9GAST|nr:hypothetical protein RRG08_012310 [Elysia crispata]
MYVMQVLHDDNGCDGLDLSSDNLYEVKFSTMEPSVLFFPSPLSCPSDSSIPTPSLLLVFLTTQIMTGMLTFSEKSFGIQMHKEHQKQLSMICQNNNSEVV